MTTRESPMIKQTFTAALFALAAASASAAPTFALPEGATIEPDSVLSWNDEESRLDYWVQAYVKSDTEGERERFASSGNLGNAFSYRLSTSEAGVPTGAEIVVRLWYRVAAGQRWQFVERNYRIVGTSDCPAAVVGVHEYLENSTDYTPYDFEPDDLGGCWVTYSGLGTYASLRLTTGGDFGADIGYTAPSFSAPGGDLLLSEEEALACQRLIC